VFTDDLSEPEVLDGPATEMETSMPSTDLQPSLARQGSESEPMIPSHASNRSQRGSIHFSSLVSL
jgi:hypothetical protein